MAEEPKGPTSPEPRSDSPAEKARSSSKPVSEGASASRSEQSELFPANSNSSGAPVNKPDAPADKPFQVQPAAQTVARGDNTMLPPKADEPAKDCPVDAEGNLIEGDAPLTTTEGTDTAQALEKTDTSDPVAVETAKDPFEDDNPYHEEQTDYHHDEYHHDEHHDEYHYDDPYYGHDDPYHGESDAGGGLGLPPGGGSNDGDDDSSHEEEEYGGPVKGFLDHLEDLRWMLIKCVVSIVVCMTVCLVAGNKIVDVLKYPLDQANGINLDLEDQQPRLHIRMGTNEWFLPWDKSENFGPIALGSTNLIKSLVIQPVQVGTNFVLALVPDPNPPAREKKKVDLTVLGPMEAFSLILDISLWGGLGIASPFVFFFVGQFVLPALRNKEKKWLYQAVTAGLGLFILGVLFCYFTVMGVTLFASAGFAEWMGFRVDQWRASEYISFTMKFMIGMGLSFELPIVLLTLVKVGLLSYERLSGMRSYMIVILLTVSGFITPSGDPFSMVLMAAPLYVLYEISILISWIWHKRELREQAAAERAEREGR